MIKDGIKRLARKCLEEKWYKLDKTDKDAWVSRCAFCRDAIDRQTYDHSYCDVCYIRDMPICRYISDTYDRKRNKKLVIKALEELAETGKLTKRTKRRLKK